MEHITYLIKERSGMRSGLKDVCYMVPDKDFKIVFQRVFRAGQFDFVNNAYLETSFSCGFEIS